MKFPHVFARAVIPSTASGQASAQSVAWRRGDTIPLYGEVALSLTSFSPRNDIVTK
jgi:hypothetical protein